MSSNGDGKIPYGLVPYEAHGLDLDIQLNHGVGDCPFCGTEGKFSADCDSGLWRCFVCGSGSDKGGGNALLFIRLLHEAALARDQGTDFPQEVARDRRLCYAETADAWGVVRSPITDHWLVPGYGTDGKLDQLYRRIRTQKNDGEWVWSLLPTPGIWPEGKVHALHMNVADYQAERDAIHIFEGPWDGMAYWEVAELEGANVVATPGCNVWRDEWTVMCRGKHVTIFYDSDHPKKQGIRTHIPGHDGVVRIAKRLSGVARSVSYLRWGKQGYDPDKPSGWDVRDALSGKPGDPLAFEDRKTVLAALVARVEPANPDWFSPGSAGVHTESTTRDNSMEARPCHSLKECEAAWDQEQGGALHWRADLSDTLKVALAVCASTQQSGNQLFVDVVGSPGSAKTTILEGALTSHHCVHVENLTKIISGFKHPDDAQKDCSFIARSNNKTWITCEFDTILSSPQYGELMGKIRRVFDGKTSATYGNMDKDRIYNALRTPWIRAGTWRMLSQDQSQLGDRFIRVIINDPTEQDRREIMRSAIRAERRAMTQRSNGTSGGIVDEKTRRAYALTGGYVDWLWANGEEKVNQIEANITEEQEDYCMDLAELSALWRARPTAKNKWAAPSYELDGHTEIPTRLCRQNMRLASHLAVVMNKEEVDADVLRVVRKVALDTAHGHSKNIASWLCAHNTEEPGGKSHQEHGGIFESRIVQWSDMKSENMVDYLLFLRKIGVLQMWTTPHHGTKWLLTDKVYEIYMRVMGGLKNAAAK